jgi:hypothetical protein
MIRAARTTAVFLSLVASAAAHHGGGTFDGDDVPVASPRRAARPW